MVDKYVQGQNRLLKEVVDQGLCVNCGACVGLCPYFNYFDGKVVVIDHCLSDVGRCLQVCPRAGFEKTAPYSREHGHGSTGDVGPCIKILEARAGNENIREKTQYGGVVSALLIFALDAGYIKSAVLTDSGGDYAPGGNIAKSMSQVLNCAGSRYSAAGSLFALNTAIRSEEEKIGVVGVPCQMEALARMRKMEPDGEKLSKRIALKIGLFCTWALDFRSLDAFLKENRINEPVIKYDILPPPSETFLVQTAGSIRKFNLSDIRPFIQKGCAMCSDLTAEYADVSVGTVEGREGWNTVIVRTETGAELIAAAVEKGIIETDTLPETNIEHLKTASRNKREKE